MSMCQSMVLVIAVVAFHDLGLFPQSAEVASEPRGLTRPTGPEVVVERSVMVSSSGPRSMVAMSLRCISRTVAVHRLGRK